MTLEDYVACFPKQGFFEIQLEGGEPTIHPEFERIVDEALARPIDYVMINTNGKRIAHDDAFLADLAMVIWIGIPVAMGFSLLAGRHLAKRILAPVEAMAARITTCGGRRAIRRENTATAGNPKRSTTSREAPRASSPTLKRLLAAWTTAVDATQALGSTRGRAPRKPSSRESRISLVRFTARKKYSSFASSCSPARLGTSASSAGTLKRTGFLVAFPTLSSAELIACTSA